MNAKEVKRISRQQNNATQEQISFLLTALRKWGFLAGMTGLAFAAVAVAAVVYFFEPVYEAKQFIHVIQDPRYVNLGGDQSKGNAGDPKFKLAPISSEFLMREALADNRILNISSKSTTQGKVQDLKRRVRIEAAGGELYAIVCKDQDPKNAAYLATRITQIFIDEFVVNLRKERNDELMETAEDQIRSAEEEMELIDQRLDEIKKLTRHIVGDTYTPDPNVNKSNMLKENLNTIKMQRTALDEELTLISADLEKDEVEIDELELQLRVENSSPVIRHVDAIKQLEFQKLQVMQRYGVQHSQVSTIDNLIAFEEQQLYDEKIRQEEILKLNMKVQKRQSIKNRQTETERKIALNDLQTKQLETQITDLDQQLEDIREFQSEYDEKTRDRTKSQAKLNRWEAVKEGIYTRDISPIEIAVADDKKVAIPSEPVEKYPFKLAALAGLAAFGFPFLIPVALEFRLRRISTPEQLRNQGNVELIGEIADLPVNSRIRGPDSRRVSRQIRLYEESVDNISAAMGCNKDDAPQILAVTSAASNEGKTTLASQYAISIARTGFERTLLIDADLRSPSIHRLFDAALDIGLVDVLSDKATMEQSVIETGIENLDILTAGKLRANPRRYFANNQWNVFLREALNHYTHIIVDTPPVLAASESMVISKACDATILCVLRDVSRVDSVKRAYARLASADVNIAGYVFGGVPQTTYSNKYGSYGYNLT